MMVRQSSPPCGPSLRGGRVPVCFDDDDETILRVGFPGFFTVFSRVMFSLVSTCESYGTPRADPPPLFPSVAPPTILNDNHVHYPPRFEWMVR
jgi:hypothetical protein